MVTAYWSVTVFEVSANPHPPPALADVVCLQELHYVSEAEVRDWFRGSVHRAFQFWLRLVLLVLAAVPSFINLSSPWWPLFVTLVAASRTVLFLFADVTFNVPCLFSLPPETGDRPVPCLGCRELWGP